MELSAVLVWRQGGRLRLLAQRRRRCFSRGPGRLWRRGRLFSGRWSCRLFLFGGRLGGCGFWLSAAAAACEHRRDVFVRFTNDGDQLTERSRFAFLDNDLAQDPV